MTQHERQSGPAAVPVAVPATESTLVKRRDIPSLALANGGARPPTPGSAAKPRIAGELWIALQASESLSTRLLQALASIAQQFTSRVSLEPPDAILLEVRGSLALFGGLQKIRSALLERCHARLEKTAVQSGGMTNARRAVTLRAGCAPTPLAALVLARAAASPVVSPVASHRQLVGTLAPLPLALLRWSPSSLRRLDSAGVQSIGEALRLPRDGFAKRFGATALRDLDRLVGKNIETRGNFTASERFRRRLDIDFELVTQVQLMSLLAPVLAELEKFLRTRQCGIERVSLRLTYRHAEQMRVVVRSASVTLEAARFVSLFEQKLARISLSAGVTCCEVRSSVLLPIMLPNASLWAAGEHGAAAGEESPLLVERLRARLGDEAVYGLCLVPEHRPERASVSAEPSLRETAAKWTMGFASMGIRRPLWLLRAPVAMPLAPQGLQLIEGPERIETGWWDGSEVARDYYIARDVRGAELWVFRERESPHAWFLHGVLA